MLWKYFNCPLNRVHGADKSMAVVRHKEAIHSGHFMVSNFEAEEDDDDDEENIGVTVGI